MEKYIGTLHQHHQDNINEVLAMVGHGVREGRIKNVYSVKFCGSGAIGDHGPTEKQIENFTTTLNFYSKDAFKIRLHNFISMVERKCNLGSESFSFEFFDKKENSLALIELV